MTSSQAHKFTNSACSEMSHWISSIDSACLKVLLKVLSLSPILVSSSRRLSVTLLLSCFVCFSTSKVESAESTPSLQTLVELWRRASEELATFELRLEGVRVFSAEVDGVDLERPIHEDYATRVAEYLAASPASDVTPDYLLRISRTPRSGRTIFANLEHFWATVNFVADSARTSQEVSDPTHAFQRKVVRKDEGQFSSQSRDAKRQGLASRCYSNEQLFVKGDFTRFPIESLESYVTADTRLLIPRRVGPSLIYESESVVLEVAADDLSAIHLKLTGRNTKTERWYLGSQASNSMAARRIPKGVVNIFSIRDSGDEYRAGPGSYALAVVESKVNHEVAESAFRIALQPATVVRSASGNTAVTRSDEDLESFAKLLDDEAVTERRNGQIAQDGVARSNWIRLSVILASIVVIAIGIRFYCFGEKK